ncbi:MAG TPA: Uma2 family endonuclease [Chloroflexota bacterium]|nr:Uma2 family endonuclease [Chloroflexota bacterium]
MVMVPEKVMQRRLTFVDYQALPDDQDYEIIDGVLYAAPRARSGHQIIANRLAHLLTGFTEDRGLGTVVPDADLIVSDRDTYVSPDIMYFAGDRFDRVDRDDWIRIMPDLVVEVLSPSTRDYDRQKKRETYAQLGVPHYWMVDRHSRAVLECILQPDGTYRERAAEASGSFCPMLFPELEIDLAQLFR